MKRETFLCADIFVWGGARAGMIPRHVIKCGNWTLWPEEVHEMEEMKLKKKEADTW